VFKRPTQASSERIKKPSLPLSLLPTPHHHPPQFHHHEMMSCAFCRCPLISVRISPFLPLFSSSSVHSFAYARRIGCMYGWEEVRVEEKAVVTNTLPCILTLLITSTRLASPGSSRCDTANAWLLFVQYEYSTGTRVLECYVPYLLEYKRMALGCDLSPPRPH